MKTIITNNNREIKIYAETFEDEAYNQIETLGNCEAYQDSNICIMPDAHAGKGCTIGTTMTISDKITPNLVGVDIGCGMLTVLLDIDEIDFEKLDYIIKNNIPNGKNIHSKIIKDFSFNELKCTTDIDRAKLSIGTLGGGNHFIEIGKGEKNNCYYLIIHSGSRKLGKEICDYYQKLTHQKDNKINEIIQKLKAEGRESEINSTINSLPKPIINELNYLSGNNFDNYIHDMKIAQHFAQVNRNTIADIIIGEMGFQEVLRFETIHNYIDFNRMILRKGAVSAEYGETLLIPINMRDGSLLCVGKGNPNWNYSAPHGAGRLMSRSKAKKVLSLDEYTESMKNVFTTSVNIHTIDEAPQVYKSINEIKFAITDTVEIVDVIKPLYNFKAND